MEPILEILPFHEAVAQERPDLALILNMIGNGTNVNEYDINGYTPLHLAVSQGNLRVIQLLLEHGTEISLKDFLSRRTSLGAAAYGMRRKSPDEIYDIYKFLLERGANCNEQDAEQHTPFLDALMFHSLKVIKLLLEHGADVRAVSGINETALHFAARNTNLDVIKFILDKGFDIECSTTRSGYSPLHFAVQFRNSEGCKFLLQRDAMVSRQTTNGITPLIIAVTHKSVDRGSGEMDQVNIVQILLDFGANVSEKTRSRSVLKIASMRNASEEVRNLLMRHVATMQSLSLTIDADDQQLINNKKCYRDYYQRCLQELENMKETKFYNNLSLFNILTESKKVIAAYARNQELVDALEGNDYESKFPVYYVWLKNRFDIEVKKQRLRSAAAKVLGDLFKLNDPLHPANQKIISYLSDEDLHFLVV